MFNTYPTMGVGSILVSTWVVMLSGVISDGIVGFTEIGACELFVSVDVVLSTSSIGCSIVLLASLALFVEGSLIVLLLISG